MIAFQCATAFSISAEPEHLIKNKTQPIMHKYLDTKSFLTIVLAGITLFFLQKYLSKKVIHEGKMSSYVGTEATGYF